MRDGSASPALMAQLHAQQQQQLLQAQLLQRQQASHYARVLRVMPEIRAAASSGGYSLSIQAGTAHRIALGSTAANTGLEAATLSSAVDSFVHHSIRRM